MRTRTLLLTIGLIGATIVSIPANTTARDCESWGVSIPREETRERFLDDVAAVSSCLAWAVGSAYEDSTYSTLIMRWNGTGWAEVPSPNRGDHSSLVSVAVTSADDAWAVGTSWNATTTRNLILHWNGSEWSIAKSPRPFDCDQLEGVDALSPTSAWAVGSSCGNEEATILRWNGTAWRTHTITDSPGGPDRLTSVAVASASQAWAVGQSDGVPLTIRWNGTRWARRATPDVGQNAILYGVTIPGGGQAIAVGHDGADRLLALHWDGSEWRRRATPDAWTSASLEDVASSSRTQVWAAGFGNTGDGQETVIVRWNGSAWRLRSTPNPDASAPYTNVLYGVGTVPGGGAWAVGSYDSGPPQPMILHCC